MKNVFQLTTLILVFVHAIGFGQSKTETETKTHIGETKTTIETEKFKDAIGSYLLEEGNFQLDIVKEGNKMFVVTEFSKDELIQKNDSTLHEPLRGVDLELVANNTNVLKFKQNGFEALIKRIKKKN